MQWRFWWHLGSECLLGLFHFSFLLLLLLPFIFCLISLIFSLFTCILNYFPLFTLQVFFIYITTSSLVFSCDSRVCEWVGLYIFIYFLCLFLCSLISVCLLWPLQMCQFCCVFLYFILYYHLEVCLFLMRDRKRMDSDGMGVGEALEELEGGETIIRMYYVRKNQFSTKLKKRPSMLGLYIWLNS